MEKRKFFNQENPIKRVNTHSFVSVFVKSFSSYQLKYFINKKFSINRLKEMAILQMYLVTSFLLIFKVFCASANNDLNSSISREANLFKDGFNLYKDYLRSKSENSDEMFENMMNDLDDNFLAKIVCELMFCLF